MAGELQLNAKHLSQIGLFGGLDEESLELLAKSLPTRRVDPGATVVSEGEPATEMFVVIGGELEVIKGSQHGGDVRVALLGPNDWFGEMALVDVQPRSATVRAVAPTLLMMLNTDHVEQLLYRRNMKAYALFMMNIARELSRKLRVADGVLAQFFTALSSYTTK